MDYLVRVLRSFGLFSPLSPRPSVPPFPFLTELFVCLYMSGYSVGHLRLAGFEKQSKIVWILLLFDPLYCQNVEGGGGEREKKARG